MTDTRGNLSVGGYDLLLAAIALPLVVAWLATALWSVGPYLAASVGSLTASGGIGYALFRVPPAAAGSE